MKKIILFCWTTVMLASCKPEIKDIGPKYEAGAGIVGSWELNKMNQTDVTQPVPETRNLDAFLAVASRKLVFTIASDGTYTVDQAGAVPKVLGTAGTWAYNQAEFPTAITFISTDADTLLAELSNMPRTLDNVFGFSFVRHRCDKDYVSYEWEFARKN